jgi:hypothetical protein
VPDFFNRIWLVLGEYGTPPSTTTVIGENLARLWTPLEAVSETINIGRCTHDKQLKILMAHPKQESLAKPKAERIQSLSQAGTSLERDVLYPWPAFRSRQQISILGSVPDLSAEEMSDDDIPPAE